MASITTSSFTREPGNFRELSLTTPGPEDVVVEPIKEEMVTKIDEMVDKLDMFEGAKFTLFPDLPLGIQRSLANFAMIDHMMECRIRADHVYAKLRIKIWKFTLSER